MSVRKPIPRRGANGQLPDLPANWWCENQADLLDLLDDPPRSPSGEGDDDAQPTDPDPERR